MSMLPFILFTVLTNAAAQLMLKQGLTVMGGIDLSGNPVLKLIAIVFHPWILAGLTTFVISMASHIFVLSRVEVSFAFPFLSLAYVLVAVAAWMWFGENLNALRIAGIGLICAGTILIAQGGQARDEAVIVTDRNDFGERS